VLGADGAVLRHIAAGLTEEPDGSAVDGLAEAGTNEAAAFGPGSRVRLVYRVSVRGLRRCGRRPIWPLGISAWERSSIWPIESGPIQRPSLVAGVRGGLGCGERGGLARIALGFAQCGLLQTLSVASGARPANWMRLRRRSYTGPARRGDCGGAGWRGPRCSACMYCAGFVPATLSPIGSRGIQLDGTGYGGHWLAQVRGARANQWMWRPLPDNVYAMPTLSATGLIVCGAMFHAWRV
jgi:hypothetical protein